MILKDARISIFINHDRNTEIQIYDAVANTTFLVIELTPNQLCSALSRMSHTHIEKAEVFSLDRIGKSHEWKSFRFEIPESLMSSRHTEELSVLCAESMQKENLNDWYSDNYYGSRDSFIRKDGKFYASVTIRRYV